MGDLVGDLGERLKKDLIEDDDVFVEGLLDGVLEGVLAIVLVGAACGDGALWAAGSR